MNVKHVEYVMKHFLIEIANFISSLQYPYGMSHWFPVLCHIQALLGALLMDLAHSLMCHTIRGVKDSIGTSSAGLHHLQVPLLHLIWPLTLQIFLWLLSFPCPLARVTMVFHTHRHFLHGLLPPKYLLSVF